MNEQAATCGSGRLSGRDGAYLLLLPVLVVVVLDVQTMSAPTMVDPWFYTAYATNPRGLMLRYGPTNYYWVRLGALIPSMIGVRLFGPVPGFCCFGGRVMMPRHAMKKRRDERRDERREAICSI